MFYCKHNIILHTTNNCVRRCSSQNSLSRPVRFLDSCTVIISLKINTTAHEKNTYSDKNRCLRD